jgi:hypothetical protein
VEEVMCKNEKFNSLNRIVYAHRLFGGSGYEKLQSAQVPLCNFLSATFFCARKNASHFSSSGTKKRHLPRTLSVIQQVFHKDNSNKS